MMAGGREPHAGRFQRTRASAMLRAIIRGDDMNSSAGFARVVAAIGGVALAWRRMQDKEHQPAWGNAPVIPAAKPQGAIPTLKMPSARGWDQGERPVAAPGLKVNAFATGLQHPRWIHVLPDGGVLVAEANQVASSSRSIFSYAMKATMR